MRTKFGKRAKRSSEKTDSSAFQVIDSAPIMDDTREVKIVLYDCLQPRVVLKKIEWPPKNHNVATISDLSSPCSSQDETLFRGFSSTDKSQFKRNDAESKLNVCGAKPTILSTMVSSAQFQLYFKEVQARLARKNEKKANQSNGVYNFSFDEIGGDENSDDYQSSLVDPDGDVISSGQTLTATDSEFCGLSECTDADVGAYAVVDDMIHEYTYDVIETVETSNVQVAHTDTVDVNPEESEDYDGDEFYDAEEGEVELGMEKEDRILSINSAPPVITADVDENELRFDYDSDDSWNSAEEIGRRHIVANGFDDSENGNLLLCEEKLEDSNSQDGIDNELENRETLENCRPLLTDILDLIESNRSVNRTESGKRIESIHLFCNVCIRNLTADGCYDIHCQFSHTLPPTHIVLNNLESASVAEVNEAYHELLLQYPKLMEQYFQAFCTFYGKNKFRTQLRDMSHICAQSKKAESFMQEIVNAFVSTGMPYGTAVDVLVNQLASSGNDTRYQILVLNVALNLKNVKLLEHLHRFEYVFIGENCAGHKEAVEKLLKINLDMYEEAITKYTLGVLKKCTIATYLQMNQMLLKSFLDAARMCGHLEAKHILHRITAANITI